MCNAVNYVMIAKTSAHHRVIFMHVWVFMYPQLLTSHFSSEKYACFIFLHWFPICCYKNAVYVCICTFSICVHLLNVICNVHLNTYRLYFVSVWVHFDSGLLKGLCIKWNHFDWTWLQGPQHDSWEKKPSVCVCGEGNYTTTCSLSVPLSRLSGPYLALMRCGNTHRHM